MSKAQPSMSTRHNNLKFEINKKINDALWHLTSEHAFAPTSDIRLSENPQILFQLEIDYSYPINDIANVIDDIERIFKESLDADIKVNRTTAVIRTPYPDYDDTPELIFTIEYEVLSWKLFDVLIESHEQLKKFNAAKTRSAKIKLKNTNKSTKVKKLEEERKLYEKLKKKFE